MLLRLGEFASLGAGGLRLLSERTLVEASLAMPIPTGLSPVTAALTEPLAVAWQNFVPSSSRSRSSNMLTDGLE